MFVCLFVGVCICVCVFVCYNLSYLCLSVRFACLSICVCTYVLMSVCLSVCVCLIIYLIANNNNNNNNISKILTYNESPNTPNTDTNNELEHKISRLVASNNHLTDMLAIYRTHVQTLYPDGSTYGASQYGGLINLYNNKQFKLLYNNNNNNSNNSYNNSYNNNERVKDEAYTRTGMHCTHYVCLSEYLFVCLSVCPFICLLFIHYFIFIFHFFYKLFLN